MALHERLGARLRRATFAMRRLLTTKLARLGVSHEQYLLLAHLGEHDDVTQAELARLTHTDGNTVTDNLRRLEAEALVRRFPDPADGRALRVQITAKGRSMRKQIMGMADEMTEQVLRGLAPTARTALLRGLDEVAHAADEALRTVE